jgi:glycosyltransferase involved in cell wall biosynthesis
MARIAIDARHIASTTGRYIEQLVNWLPALGQDNDYLLLLRPQDHDRYLPKAASVSAIAAPQPLYGIGEQTGLLRLLDRLEADLVHFCMPTQPILYHGLTITTFHDLTQLTQPTDGPPARAKQAVARFVYRRAARSSELLITPSETVRAELIAFAGLPAERVRVTYEAADPPTDAGEPVPGLGDARFLLYVGSHARHKNVRILIQAHQQLRAKHPELQLVLAGTLAPDAPGTAAVTRAWTDAQRFDGIVYTGYVSDGQLAWLYGNALAFVFPSFGEGFGLPGLEAMAGGTPVLSSSATCLPEIYGDAAVYFSPDDIPGLVDSIDRLLGAPELRTEMIVRGHAQAAKYSWERLARQTLAIYNEALRR